MPALNIKDPTVHELAVELARQMDQSLTQAVKESLRESLARRRSGEEDSRHVLARRVLERVMRIGRNIAAMPVLDSRTPDEILGYNDFGLPE
jgi:antitoxin VapB